jgi:hypothetical protein
MASSSVIPPDDAVARPEAVARSKVKGSVIRELLVWSLDRSPPGTGQRMLSRMRPEDRSLVDPSRPAMGIISSEWYSSLLVHALLDVMVEGLDREQQRRLAREANAYVVPRLISGTYRALFRRLGTPALYARFIQHAWRQLHTTGERTMFLREPGLADSEVSSWPGHHPALCDCTVETMAELFRIMLQTDVQVIRISCVSEKADSCRTVLRWTPA